MRIGLNGVSPAENAMVAKIANKPFATKAPRHKVYDIFVFLFVALCLSGKNPYTDDMKGEFGKICCKFWIGRLVFTPIEDTKND